MSNVPPLKEIARRLREVAANLPDCAGIDEPLLELKFGTFTIRCRPEIDAVNKIAAKFEKASRSGVDMTTVSNGKRQGTAVRYKEDGTAIKSHAANARWFATTPLPLNRCGE